MQPIDRPRQSASQRADRFLDPRVLGRIGSLQLLAKTVVEGFVSGLHRSPFLGRSMDFAEYRSYLPGDDLRQIDWKLFSRSDRHYVKQFEGDTNTNLTVLVDVSGSMNYCGEPASGRPSKLDTARYLAASLAYMAQKQRDRPGLILFSDSVRQVVPNGARQLDSILAVLSACDGFGESNLEQALAPIASGLRRRGMVAVISDLYEPAAQVVKSIAQLKLRGTDVVVFHVLDPTEIKLPSGDTVEFEDLESGALMAVEPEILQERYEKRVRRHIAEVERGLVRTGVDYHLTMTDEPLDASLHRYLASRLWTMKSR